MAVELLEGLLASRAPKERLRLFEGRARWAAAVLGDHEPEAADRRPGPGKTLAILDGLTRVLAALAAEHPVGILVDDVHWADVPSLRWLVHLSGRLASLPVLVVVGIRAGEREETELLARLLAGAAVRLVLAPLSRAATGGLVADLLG